MLNQDEKKNHIFHRRGVLLLGIAVLIQFVSPNISDPDGLYHITHAKIYKENGIFYNEFPWAQFSVIKI